MESPEPADVIPLSEGRYLVRFTADQQMQDKLTQAQELMRHQVPRGDFVAVIDRALDLLIAERKKKLFGLLTKPRSSRTAVPVASTEGASADDAAQTPTVALAVAAEEAAAQPGESNGVRTFEFEAVGSERTREREPSVERKGSRSRYIPRAVRREVMARDEFQCTFIGPEGNRCPERGRLQLDHYPVPESCGGPATTDNLRVRCAAHNLLAAEQFFGLDQVLQKIAASRARASVSKRDTSRGPDHASVDVGSQRLDTPRTHQADSHSRRENESVDNGAQIARSSA